MKLVKIILKWYLISAACLLWTVSAEANIEPQALFDTRSFSMGGAGVALSGRGFSSHHNPAVLSEIDNFTLALGNTSLFPRLKAPWIDPLTSESKSHASIRGLAPLPILSVGKRINERVVGGLGILIPAGAGASYDCVPGQVDNKASAAGMIGEFQLPVSVQVTDRIVIGAAYRLSFGLATMNMMMPVYSDDGTSSSVSVISKQAGVNATGFQLGTLVQLNDNIQIGVNYRSKSIINLKGEIKDAQSGQILAEADKNVTEFGLPHTITVGTAISLPESNITLASDFKYWTYGACHTPGGAGVGTQWKDAMNLSVGMEYKLSELIPLRFGVGIAKSGLTEASAMAFLPPPGLSALISIGTGIWWSNLGIDIGAGYMWAEEQVDSAPISGIYGFDAPILSLTLKYDSK
jgi:long-subunit fatty acid transport protein